MSTYSTFKAAVQQKRPVRCVYKDLVRFACPHAVGIKNGQEKVLVFQYAGETSTVLPVGGEWRCMFVNEVTSVEIIEGAWHTDGRHSRPQTCIDEVDVEVS